MVEHNDCPHTVSATQLPHLQKENDSQKVKKQDFDAKNQESPAGESSSQA